MNILLSKLAEKHGGDPTVAGYLHLLRIDPEKWQDYIFGLVDTLIRDNRGLARDYGRLFERATNPPMIVIEKGSFTNMNAEQLHGRIMRVEPEKPQPAEIYFRDFIRSWWKRLTRPPEP